MTTALAAHEIANRETLRRAELAGDLALVRTTLATEIPAGTEIAALAAIVQDDTGEYLVTPLAMMIPGNPYETLADPTQEDPR